MELVLVAALSGYRLNGQVGEAHQLGRIGQALMN